MAKVVVSMKIMPEDPSVDLNKLEKKVIEAIKSKIGSTETKTEKEPIGFGLNALKIIFVMNENDKLEPIEQKVGAIDGVNSVEVTDVRRAIG